MTTNILILLQRCSIIAHTLLYTWFFATGVDVEAKTGHETISIERKSKGTKMHRLYSAYHFKIFFIAIKTWESKKHVHCPAGYTESLLFRKFTKKLFVYIL